MLLVRDGDRPAIEALPAAALAEDPPLLVVGLDQGAVGSAGIFFALSRGALVQPV